MQKKRLLALVLCVVLSVTLCACGTKNAVKKELIGIYVGGNENYTRAIGFEEDGTFVEAYESLIGDKESEGTWEIKRDTVVLEYDKGSTHYYTYEYNKKSGTVTLYWNSSSGPDYDDPYVKYKSW